MTKKQHVPAVGALVTETNNFDVLMGRGKNASNRPGNIKFRALAAALSADYNACEYGEERNRLALKIVSDIQAEGGRFLRGVTASNSKGIIFGAWEVVCNDVAVAKVKQVFRDLKEDRKSKRQTSKQRQWNRRMIRLLQPHSVGVRKSSALW